MNPGDLILAVLSIAVGVVGFFGLAAAVAAGVTDHG